MEFCCYSLHFRCSMNYFRLALRFRGLFNSLIVFRPPNIFGCLVPADTLLGRWRLTLDLFGRVFCDDVGAEPGSIISELGGFVVKEVKFRRDMERLRNSQQKDLTLEVPDCKIYVMNCNLFLCYLS